MVTPTQQEKYEWACVAEAAYKAQYNEIGHTFSVAATLPNGAQITVKQFDELQSNYRQWRLYGKLTLADGRTVQLGCPEKSGLLLSICHAHKWRLK
jgi:hypothetical protein